MITKEIIAERVLKAVSGGSIISYRKLDPREIYESIETNRNAIMQEIVLGGGVLDGEFVTTFKNVPILDDPETALRFSIMPTKLISFADGGGIRQISPMKNQGLNFIRINGNTQGMFAPLESSKLQGRIGFYPERTKVGTDQSIRVVYKGCPFQYKDVLMKVIASSYDFDEDEALPIPAAFEEKLVTMVIQSFAMNIGMPIDVKNDSEPETT